MKAAYSTVKLTEIDDKVKQETTTSERNDTRQRESEQTVFRVRVNDGIEISFHRLHGACWTEKGSRTSRSRKKSIVLGKQIIVELRCSLINSHFTSAANFRLHSCSGGSGCSL